MNIQNKTVVITGASKGIGAAAARAFVNEGARVVLAARSDALINKLSTELGSVRTSAIHTDMTHPDDVRMLMQHAVDRFGQIDILVNNAGVGLAGKVDSLNTESLGAVMDLNLIGPVYAIQAAVPYLRNSGGGLIINISSMVTRLPLPFIGGYRATKMALDAISDGARIELAPLNIRVITVYPGLTATEFAANVIDRDKVDNRIRNKMKPQSAAFVAQKIVQAARREPRVQFMGFSHRALAVAGSLAPGLLEHIIARRSIGSK